MQKKLLSFLLVMMMLLTFSGISPSPAKAETTGPTCGPLTKSANGFFFQDRSGKALFLTGVHNWESLQDYGNDNFDYNSYLDFMAAHNMNFLRLWNYENGESGSPDTYGPVPYPRAGPGLANDGQPKFDASGDYWNQAYFDRLRARVIAAQQKGIYVDIMLFQGWSVNWWSSSDPFQYHWFNSANNINGISATAANVHTLNAPQAVLDSQKKYIKKVIDTIDDLDNVVYEISNEDSHASADWQNAMIDYIKTLSNKPVGMTGAGGDGIDPRLITTSDLLNSRADWISPQFSVFPPDITGGKVVITDTDHYGADPGNTKWIPGQNGTPATDPPMNVWAWMEFTRGYNVMLMDGDLSDTSGNAGRIAARWALNDVETYAEKVNLAGMTPRDGLSSTGYCLAQPGSEYMVFQPVDNAQFTVSLTAATYSVEWFSLNSRTAAEGADITAGGGSVLFKAPFSGPAVLYLKFKSSNDVVPSTGLTKGPLTKSANGYFFRDKSGKALFLTGVHNWESLQDYGNDKFDYNSYLDFMVAHNMNFLRLWNYENAESGSGATMYGPVPYPRAGPGLANDGQPKFDASGDTWNQAYFDRLRQRVIAAQQKGIYVDIMLFQGWSVNWWSSSDPFQYHWFNSANNINGISATTANVHTLNAPQAVIESQQKYIKKVIDTVDDLDNVVYEISNEDSHASADWQNAMIDYIRTLSSKPVGMTGAGGDGIDPRLITTSDLVNSHADWISPQFSVYPPDITGNKVIITDTDHYGANPGNTKWIPGVNGAPASDPTMDLWVWMEFTRGYNVMLMDGGLSDSETNGRTQARLACSDAETYASKVDLAGMTPQDSLSSTGYCLAQPGSEYIVLQPADSAQFTVNLTAGVYSAEWFSLNSRTSVSGKTFSTGGGTRTFAAAFTGPAVLYLKYLRAYDANADITAAKAALEETDFIFAPGDNKDNVTNDFTLPLTGEWDTAITWSEKGDKGNSVRIDPKTGIVTVKRSNSPHDRTVTLIAVISKQGGTSQTKELSVTVKSVR